MAYTRLHWVESETPLSADNMNNIEDGIEELKSQKVDKVSGKALSDQNYTAAEKTKLAGIEAGAEVNVQSDWNQTNTSADDFIQNKPVNATTSTAGFMSASDKSKLDGIEPGAEVNLGISIQGEAVNEDALELQFDGFMVVHAGYGTPGAITRRTTISLPAASASNNGYMSKEDKAKLNGIKFAKITATLDSTVKIAAGKHTNITYKNDSIGNYKAIIPLRIPVTDGLLLRGFRTSDVGFMVDLSNITDSTKTVTAEAAILLGINY